MSLPCTTELFLLAALFADDPVLEARLLPQDETAGDGLGFAVAVDGDWIIAGSPGDEFQGLDAGAALFFERGADAWTEEDTEGQPVPGGELGYSVAIDANRAAAGAWMADDKGAVFTYRDFFWAPISMIQPADLEAGDRFGVSVDLSGDFLVAGNHLDDDVASNAGAIYVFEIVGTIWFQRAKLFALDASNGDAFGRAVAIDGDTLVAGAPNHDDLATNAGAAYVFRRSGTTWTQEAELLAPDAAEGARFGYSVAISGDAVVVGAHDADASGVDSGAAYVYRRTGTTWALESQLLAATAGDSDDIGRSVAIDGNTAVIGARQDDDSANNSGAAYVFVESGGSWTEQAKLVSGEMDSGDRFGHSVSIDGDTIAVGAYLDDESASNAGACYVFERSGTSWSQTVKRINPGDVLSDNTGNALAFSGDTLVIGAVGNDDRGVSAGCVHVWRQQGTSWTKEAQLHAGDAQAQQQFGAAVAIHDDTLVVGGQSSEAAYVFVRSGTAWTEQAKLTSTNTTLFGRSVTIEGDTILVGSPGEDAPAMPFTISSAGAAYVFQRTGTVWSQTQRLVPSNPGAPLIGGSAFGASLSLEGDQCAIGAPGHPAGSLPHSGGVYLLTRAGTTWTESAILASPSPQQGFGVGKSVSLEAPRVLAGASEELAHVFQGAGSSWSFESTLTESGLPSFSGYGQTVSLDGTRAYLGAHGADTVFIYERSGVAWNLDHELVGEANTRFGWAVSSGSSRLFASATLNDDEDINAGAVDVFLIPDPVPFEEFCFGDGGDQMGCTNCPCANNAAQGTIGGCLNGVSQSAHLIASGAACVSSDTLRFEMTGGNPSTFAVLASADNRLPNAGPCLPGSGIASPLLDGLRCIGGGLLRHGSRPTDGAGDIGFTTNGWGPPNGPAGGILAQGGFSAGQTRQFQVFYREQAELVCMTGQNTSSAVSVTVGP